MTKFILTGVRDYIHVVDLAKGHVAALKQIEEKCGCKVRLKTFIPKKNNK